ncbi:MAG: GntR family transcriptional regulator [Candidatus Dormibacteria bacterium]
MSDSDRGSPGRAPLNLGEPDPTSGWPQPWGGQAYSAEVVALPSKTGMVVDTVREMILTGQLLPGSALRQRDLAKLLGVSPTPVREAIRKLESEGLVHFRTRRGAIVAPADPGQLEESLRILAVLEGLAGRMAVEQMVDSDLHEIEALQEELVRCRGDERRRKELNRRFHFRIYACARSPMLLSLMRILWLAFPGGPQVGRPLDQSLRGHRRQLAALRSRDPVAVTQAIEEHVIGMIDHLRVKPPPIGSI